METYPAPSPEAVAAIGIVFFLVIALISLAATFIAVLIYCKIFAKAGYSWALGILMVVPVANIIMPFVLAFGDWPVLRELRQLKQNLEQK